MDGTKSKLFIVALVVIIVIIASIGLILMKDSSNGFTAMDAKLIADEQAELWNSNAVAQQLRASTPNEHGFAEYWIVTYAIQTEVGMNTSLIEYKVYSNNTIIEIPRSDQYYTGYNLEANWTIDSDDACDISNSCSELQQWQSRYPDGYIETMGFGRNSYYSDYPICSIDWMSWGFMDDPHSCRLIINAENGEIIQFDDNI